MSKVMALTGQRGADVSHPAFLRRDVPLLVEHYRNGDLRLDELISATITLDEVNDAFEAMKNGDVGPLRDPLPD